MRTKPSEPVSCHSGCSVTLPSLSQLRTLTACLTIRIRRPTRSTFAPNRTSTSVSFCIQRLASLPCDSQGYVVCQCCQFLADLIFISVYTTGSNETSSGGAGGTNLFFRLAISCIHAMGHFTDDTLYLALLSVHARSRTTARSQNTDSCSVFIAHLYPTLTPRSNLHSVLLMTARIHTLYIGPLSFVNPAPLEMAHRRRAWRVDTRWLHYEYIPENSCSRSLRVGLAGVGLVAISK